MIVQHDQEYEDLVRHEGLLRMRSSIVRHAVDDDEEEEEQETKMTLFDKDASKAPWASKDKDGSDAGVDPRGPKKHEAVAVFGPDAQGDAQAVDEYDEDDDDETPVYEGDAPSDRERGSQRDIRRRLGRSSTSKRRNHRGSTDGGVKPGSVVDEDPNNLGRLLDRNGGSAEGDGAGDIDDEAMNSEWRTLVGHMHY